MAWATRTADKLRPQSGPCPFSEFRIGAKKMLGHHQAQHGIAEKLQLFVVILGVMLGLLFIGNGAVRERQIEHCRMAKPIPKRPLQPLQQCGAIRRKTYLIFRLR
jgi:hypothetical protein